MLYRLTGTLLWFLEIISKNKVLVRLFWGSTYWLSRIVFTVPSLSRRVRGLSVTLSVFCEGHLWFTYPHNPVTFQRSNLLIPLHHYKILRINSGLGEVDQAFIPAQLPFYSDVLCCYSNVPQEIIPASVPLPYTTITDTFYQTSALARFLFLMDRT